MNCSDLEIKQKDCAFFTYIVLPFLIIPAVSVISCYIGSKCGEKMYTLIKN